MKRAGFHLFSLLFACLLFIGGHTVFAAQRINSEAQKSTKSAKTRLAVFDKVPSEYREWAKDIASSTLENELFEQGYDLVARKNLESVMEELEISSSAMFDPNAAAKVGKQASAKYLVLVKVLGIEAKSKKLGIIKYGAQGVETTTQIQVMDVETGDIIFSKTYTEKSKDQMVMDKEDANGLYKAGFRQAMSIVARKFVTDAEAKMPLRSNPPSAPSDSPAPSSSSKPPGTAANVAMPEHSAAPGKPQNAEPTPAPPAAKIDGEVVFIDEQQIGVEITDVQVGQVLVVYTRRERIENSAGELLSYRYSSKDLCAKLKITEVQSKMVIATLMQTYAPTGKADPTPRADRVVKFFPVKKVS